MKKCSLEEHKEIDAISFCQKCSIYMCNKCEKHHSELFKNHNQFKLIKDNNEIFIGLCDIHSYELKYFCKNHNKLCCVECITKIKTRKGGQHLECSVCEIEDIENDKKDKLKENIKYLEELSINLQDSINELKLIVEKIEKNKDEIKMNIQNIFTKLRNALNDREDELLSEVNNKYNEILDEEMMKETQKLPNKIKISIEKGKEIENNWKNIILNSKINDCLNIENNINNINKIKKCIENKNSFNFNFNFFPKDDGINQILEQIKNLGNIKSSSNSLFNSAIEFDEDLIKTWLNNKKFSSELLFRKTIDGSTPDDFHNKCDNKGITIVFIETTKGYKFGGYTELPWDKSGNKTDKSTFIFSFNNKQKYIPRNGNNTIGCHSNEGPRFGCGWPEIYFLNSLNKGNSYDGQNCTFIPNRKLTNGEFNWEVKELEVYKISYL